MLFFGYKERMKKIMGASKERMHEKGIRTEDEISPEEYERNPLEKNDLLALIISAFVVFVPIIVILMALTLLVLYLL